MFSLPNSRSFVEPIRLPSDAREDGHVVLSRALSGIAWRSWAVSVEPDARNVRIAHQWPTAARVASLSEPDCNDPIETRFMSLAPFDRKRAKTAL
jgi:hypothetical protein